MKQCLINARLRRGISLVQVLVVISIMSVTMTLTAVSLRRAFNLHHEVRIDLEESATVDRFANQWRHDVHRAKTSKLESSTACRLDFSEAQFAEYRFTEWGVERTVTRGTVMEFREVYRLSERWGGEFATEPLSEKTALIAKLSRTPRGSVEVGPSSRVAFQNILAVVELHHAKP